MASLFIIVGWFLIGFGIALWITNSIEFYYDDEDEL